MDIWFLSIQLHYNVQSAMPDEIDPVID